MANKNDSLFERIKKVDNWPVHAIGIGFSIAMIIATIYSANSQAEDNVIVQSTVHEHWANVVIPVYVLYDLEAKAQELMDGVAETNAQEREWHDKYDNTKKCVYSHVKNMRPVLSCFKSCNTIDKFCSTDDHEF